MNRNPEQRNLGPIWRICQMNVEGISRAKSEYMSRLFKEEEVNVALIQETHTETPEDLRKRGYIHGFR